MAKVIKKETSEKSRTEQQIRIQRMREELNKRDPDEIAVFTKYKNITYLCNVLFPPYGLYRIWCKNSEFTGTERFVQTTVCILIVLYFISFRFGI